MSISEEDLARAKELETALTLVGMRDLEAASSMASMRCETRLWFRDVWGK